VAGTNSSGFSGDGGPAVNAKLNAPEGMVMDRWGNLFFADTANSRIREINTNGVITTVAGTSPGGFSGDGGLAVAARIAPVAVAVDISGNLFIADEVNNRIRRVDGNGIITTFAGNGNPGYSGDNGAATNASLDYPDGIAVDNYGDVFIADSRNYCIRMVDFSGKITTIVGNGEFGIFGDGGPATSATLGTPQGLAVDSYGGLYIATDDAIRKVDFGRNPALQLNNVWATNAGNYDVVVTSPYGSVTSSIVSLTVLLPPAIAAQPVSGSVPLGGSANFSVAVSNNPPFGYQWFTSSGRAASGLAYLTVFGTVPFVFVTDGGEGYVSPPQVHFVGGGGSGTAATATVQAGTVASITITSEGSGYATPPTIQIDPPSPVINAALPGGTNSTLVVSPVTSAAATNYFVVVTNIYGSVTSSVAALWVFLAPQNFTAGMNGTNLQVQLSGTPVWPYILQSATNLTPPINWQSVATNQADTNGNWRFTIRNPTSRPGCFYRAVAQ